VTAGKPCRPEFRIAFSRVKARPSTDNLANALRDGSAGERLFYEIEGPVFYRLDRRRNAGNARHDNEGSGVAGSIDILENIESGPGWQENIENNAGRRRPRSRDCLELFSVTKARHAVAFGGKSHIEKIANCRIIVDDKYLIADAA